MSSAVAITLPGDIPGLLRRGAPLRYYGYRAVAVTDPCDGVLLLSDGVSLVKSGHFFVALDLYAPAGRDIAARWMAERLGLEVGLTAPQFQFYFSFRIDQPDGWYIQGTDATQLFCNQGSVEVDTGILVPGLPLDPDRGVEALRLCVLHLAGRL